MKDKVRQSAQGRDWRDSAKGRDLAKGGLAKGGDKGKEKALVRRVAEQGLELRMVVSFAEEVSDGGEGDALDVVVELEVFADVVADDALAEDDVFCVGGDFVGDGASPFFYAVDDAFFCEGFGEFADEDEFLRDGLAAAVEG